MTLERWIEGQRLRDNQAAVAKGQGLLREFGDVPLTIKLEVARKPEIVLPSLSPETQRLVERMQNDGYAVYDTAGKTPLLGARSCT